MSKWKVVLPDGTEFPPDGREPYATQAIAKSMARDYLDCKRLPNGVRLERVEEEPRMDYAPPFEVVNTNEKWDLPFDPTNWMVVDQDLNVVATRTRKEDAEAKAKEMNSGV